MDFNLSDEQTALRESARSFARKELAPLAEAIERTNQSRYGLTSAIHTKNIDQALLFANQVKTGVVNINIGTFGSEAHVPFGGFKDSGNGSREPGTEAIDFYSELKVVSMLLRSELV